MSDKGAELNRRVWSLFEEAGFLTKPSSDDPAEEVVWLSPKQYRTPDLSATDKETDVKIIGWNKDVERLRESLTVHIHDYGILKEKAGADGVLFVSPTKKVSSKHRQYAEDRGMQVWGEKELLYYEALVDAIGPYARYEIINSFGIATFEETLIHNVLALRLHQPHSQADTDLFIFTLTPDVLLKTCVVFRRAGENAEAYQRMVKKKRLAGIGAFVSQADALLPPNIIVNLGEKVAWNPVEASELKYTDGKPVTVARRGDYELVVLNIPLAYASMELVDGQHRLYGFAKAEPAARQRFNLIVLGIAGLPFERRRDTFVAINSKAQRVDPNLVTYLKYTDDEEECQRDSELMAIKIAVKLNEASPFEDMIRLLDTDKQVITLKGFSGYDLRGLVGRRGLLRRYYPHESRAYVSALRLYFGILKDLFEEEWLHPEEYIIATNRGISALLKLLRSILRTLEGPLDENVVKGYLEVLRDNWQGGWMTSQLRNSYVGSKGWKDFHRDLVRAIQETHSNFQE